MMRAREWAKTDGMGAFVSFAKGDRTKTRGEDIKSS